MGYKFKGSATEEAVSAAEDAIRAKLASLARLEAEVDERIARIRNAPVFRARGATPSCGTHSGYKTHIINKTPICDPCRTARALYQREYRNRKKQALCASH